jgi:hypothetical protein
MTLTTERLLPASWSVERKATVAMVSAAALTLLQLFLAVALYAAGMYWSGNLPA